MLYEIFTIGKIACHVLLTVVVLRLGSLSKSLRRPLLRRSWMRCPGESTSRSSPNFKLGSCSLAFAIIYQQQNPMVVK